MTRFLQDNDLYRTVILTILAGLAILAVSLANRDVYAKEDIDARFQAQERLFEERYRYICANMEHMRKDIEWLVRREGGTPSAVTDQNNHTPQ